MATMTEAIKGGKKGEDVLTSIAEEHDLKDANELRAELDAASVRRIGVRATRRRRCMRDGWVCALNGWLTKSKH